MWRRTSFALSTSGSPAFCLEHAGQATSSFAFSNSLLPFAHLPPHLSELDNGNCTPAETPVLVQLLGSDPACMAENAAQVARLSPSRHRSQFRLSGADGQTGMVAARRCSTIPKRGCAKSSLRCGRRCRWRSRFQPKCGWVSATPTRRSIARGRSKRAALPRWLSMRERAIELPAAGLLGVGGQGTRGGTGAGDRQR